MTATDRQVAICPACSTHSSPAGRKAALNLWRCPECTLVFTHPQPRALVDLRYREDYDLAAHFDETAPRKRALFGRRLAEISAQTSVGRLCDVGCAGGQFLDLAKEAGWDVFGIELNPPAVQRARSTGSTVVEGRLEELEDLPWGRFDVVSSWDVLEHTPDPAPFVRRLHRLLRPGGRLFVTTLNWNSLVRRVFGMRWSLVVDDHFTYWTEQALARTFSPLLEVASISTFGLGRDFFAPVDALVRRRRSRSTGDGGGGIGSRSWDSLPAVLTAEHAVNAFLGSTGLGVELYGAFEKRAD
jgi:SAM-dependent methyltransferase